MSRFLNAVLPPNPKNIVATLPLDIFVTNISHYLTVEDILALRRVNKHFFHLTHEPLIWKRFVHCLKVPLPPIRPAFQYHAQATDYEFEQLASRAISMEINWRRVKPAITSTTFFDASLEVLDMKILSGGKYLVACIRDQYRFFIALYHLEHPSGPHILARCEIPSKACQLQAKYMLYKGEPVIMIAYVYRVLAPGAAANIDTSQFANNPEVDLPDTVHHFLSCIHVDMNTLELLSGAHRDPNGPETIKHKWWSSNRRYKPFQQTVLTRLEVATLQVSLYSQNGIPHVSAIQPAPLKLLGRQDSLTIINIEHPFRTFTIVLRPLFYAPPGLVTTPNWVKAVRHIPDQDNLVVWRTIQHRSVIDHDHPEPRRLVDLYTNTLEMFKLPELNPDAEGIYYAKPFDSTVIFPEQNVKSVCISDDYWPVREQAKVPWPLAAHLHPPPPITIWAELTKPHRGLFHWHIWPQMYPRRPEEPPSFFYAIPDTIKQTMHDTYPDYGRVIPGVYRTLIYTINKDDRRGAPSMTSLRRYISPQFQFNTYTMGRVRIQSVVERRQYPRVPLKVYTKLDLGEETAARYMEYGLGAITWDESIGRVCLTTGGGSEIQVIDYSRAASIRERFMDWKMANSGGFEYREENEAENEFVAARKARPRVFGESTGPQVDVDVDMDQYSDSDESSYFSDDISESLFLRDE